MIEENPHILGRIKKNNPRLLIFLSVLGLTITVLLSFSVTQAANLAPNSSFETAPTPPYNSSIYPTSATPYPAFTWATDAAHTGTHSLKIQTAPNFNGTLSRWSLWLPNGVQAGKPYVARGWIKTANVSNSGVITLRFFKNSTNLATLHSPGVSGTSDWTQVAVQGTAPAGTNRILVEFLLYGRGTMWADDLEVTDELVDTTPPTGSIIIDNGATSTKNPTVTLTLSATDNSGTVREMQFSNDNINYSTPEAYAASKTWTLSGGDGTKTVHVKFKDAADNWSTAFTDTIVLDATAPLISALSASQITASTTMVTWTTNEPATSQIDYGFDTNYGLTTIGTALVTDHSLLLSDLQASTTYHYRVSSTDSLGNGALSADLTFTTAPPPPPPPLDTTPPLVTITEPLASATLSSTVVVRASSSDDIGVTKLEFYIDKILAATLLQPPYEVNWNTTSWSNGAHLLTATAYDAAANSSTDVVTINVSNPDILPAPSTHLPVISDFTPVLDSGCSTCSVQWVGAELEAKIGGGNDAVDTAYGLKDFGGTNGWEGRIYTRSILRFAPNQNINANLAIFQARDVNDNLIFELYISGSGKTINLWSPLGGLAAGSLNQTTDIVLPNNGTTSYRVEVSALQNNSVIVRVDDIDKITLTDLSGATTGNARYLRAGIDHYDTATTSEPASLYHSQVGVTTQGWLGIETADSEAPQVTLIKPSDGATLSGVTALEATSTDNRGVTVVQFLLDDAVIASDDSNPYSVSWDSETAASGTHLLQAKAFDAAGNSQLSNAISVTITKNRTPLTFIRNFVDPEGGQQSETSGLAVGDIDGDGKVDVIVGGSQTLVWYRNPDWTSNPISTNAQYGEGSHITTRDINGDGRLDVVTGEQLPGSIERTVWFENTPTAWIHHILSSAEYCHDLRFGDLDSDGRADAACLNQRAPRIVWLKAPVDPTTEWQSQIIESNRGAMGLELVDLDSDGRTDVVAGRAWYRNTDASPWLRYPYTELTGIYSGFNDYAMVSVLDLDGKGPLDIFATMFAETPVGKAYAFLAPNDLFTGSWTAVPVDSEPLFGVHSQRAANFDGTGGPQVMIGESNFGGFGFGPNLDPEIFIYRLVGSPASASGWERTAIDLIGTHEAAVADLDGDGKPDIAGHMENTNFMDPPQYGPVHWWKNDTMFPPPPATTFSRHIIDLQSGGQPTTSSAVGDIDGDGKIDVVVAGPQSLLWYQNPDWASTTIALGNFYHGVDTVTRDLNSDGRLDVITGQNIGGVHQMVWFENTLTGWVRHILSSAEYCHDLPFRDLDGDGLADAACLNKEVPRIVWLKAPVDPTTEWQSNLIENNRRSSGAALADIDRDGRLDLVAGRAWYRNTGVSPWPRYPFTEMTNPLRPGMDDEVQLAVLDLNNDGRLDIFATIFAEVPEGQVWAFLAPPNPVTDSWTPFQVDPGPLFGVHSMVSANFDGSGRPQISVGEAQIGGWNLGPNPDPQIFMYQLVGSPTTQSGWKRSVIDTIGVTSAHVADFNGDGAVDFQGHWEDGEKLNPPQSPIYWWENITPVIASTSLPNQFPTVSLTSPSSGAAFVEPATITLTADATDSDGSISKVEFLQGATLLGTDTSIPYGFDWNNVPAGNYSLTARATDNLGATTTSTVVSVEVIASSTAPTSTTPNQPPTISLTSPTSGAIFTAPAVVSLVASATDPDGGVSRVEFFEGTALLGTDTTGADGWSFAWSNVASGIYSLTARATDTNGSSTSSEIVNITVNAPPPTPGYDDEFDTGGPTPEAKWAFVGGGTSAVNVNSLAPGKLRITIDPSTVRQCWTGGSPSCVRLMELAPTANFQVDIKEDTTVPVGSGHDHQMGFLAYQDSTNFIRFEQQGIGSGRYINAHKVINNVGKPWLASCANVPATASLYLRVNRSSDTWTLSYSTNGSTYTTCGSFVQALDLTKAGAGIGLYLGNNGSNTAFTSGDFDYIRVTGL